MGRGRERGGEGEGSEVGRGKGERWGGERGRRENTLCSFKMIFSMKI